MYFFNCWITTRNNNNKCNLCTIKSESIKHLFFHCNKSKQLWMKLEYLISVYCHFNVHFSLCEIIFGYETEKNNNLNFKILILFTKRCIFYKSRKSWNLFYQWTKKFNIFIYLIEKKVYATQMMLDKFTIRWSMLDNSITSLE